MDYSTAPVIALLDSGYQPPAFISKDVESHLKGYKDQPNARAALVWLIDHEPDLIVIIGALVQYALVDRGMVLCDATFLESTGYVHVLIDCIFVWSIKNAPWDTGMSLRDAFVPVGVSIIDPVNTLIKRLHKHGHLVTTVQHQVSDNRLPVGGRAAIVVHEEEYDVRYQPASDADVARWKRADECWGEDGMYRAEDRTYGFIVKQFRTFFPAYTAVFMLSLSDEAQWQPVQR